MPFKTTKRRLGIKLDRGLTCVPKSGIRVSLVKLLHNWPGPLPQLLSPPAPSGCQGGPGNPKGEPGSIFFWRSVILGNPFLRGHCRGYEPLIRLLSSRSTNHLQVDQDGWLNTDGCMEQVLLRKLAGEQLVVAAPSCHCCLLLLAGISNQWW